VELGQLLVLAIAIPAVALLFRYFIAERMGIIILSALVAHSAWHWMVERGQTLSQYPLSSFLDAVTLSNLLGWAIALLVASALAWLVSDFFRRKGQPEPKGLRREPAGEPAPPAAE
jgi:hypothetical protein